MLSKAENRIDGYEKLIAELKHIVIEQGIDIGELETVSELKKFEKNLSTKKKLKKDKKPKPGGDKETDLLNGDGKAESTISENQDASEKGTKSSIMSSKEQSLNNSITDLEIDIKDTVGGNLLDLDIDSKQSSAGKKKNLIRTEDVSTVAVSVTESLEGAQNLVSSEKLQKS